MVSLERVSHAHCSQNTESLQKPDPTDADVVWSLSVTRRSDRRARVEHRFNDSNKILCRSFVSLNEIFPEITEKQKQVHKSKITENTSIIQPQVEN